MALTSDQLNELSEIGKKAALAAGEIINSTKGSSVAVQSKDGGENLASQVVTEIDHRAQEAILSHLTPTLSEYNLGLLTEESTDDETRFTHDYFWCIDPLDGTLCFSRDEEGYSTSIALVAKDGTPTIGIVYSPRTQTLYSAIKGAGALKNGEPLTVLKFADNLTLLYDQSYKKHPQFSEQVEQLKRDLKTQGLKELVILELGGAVMNGITTIDRAPALYYKFPKKADGGGSLWDFAASSIIQSEAGGFNSDYERKPLDLNRADSTFMNHRGVIFASSRDLLDLIP